LPALRRPRELLVSLCNFGPRRTEDQLLVVHDAAPVVVPETFSPLYRRAHSAFSVAVARRARRVVTVSERAKIDLITHYGLKPDLIDVVPNGVGAEFSPGEVAVERPYCLFVGAHDPRKNLAFLEALWPEVERRTGLGLVAVGRSASSAHRPARSSSALSDVGDRELIDLYRGATLVLQPSRYEGFGLPALEGSACGTPFLSTDVGAAVELAADPDRQVLPLDPDIWVEAITAHAGLDSRARTETEAAALRVARRFTWERSARLLAASIAVAAEEAP
jgi:glycosyltransferase involved in cell wall biosynthesis